MSELQTDSGTHEDAAPRTAPTRGRHLADKRADTGLERGIWIGLAVAIVAVAALIPVGAALDARADRQRAMYGDVQRMAELQYLRISNRGVADEVTVAAGESADLGKQTFTASPGVTVEVTSPDEGYCIRASNEHGDVTDWRCDDGTTDPAKVD